MRHVWIACLVLCLAAGGGYSLLKSYLHSEQGAVFRLQLRGIERSIDSVSQAARENDLEHLRMLHNAGQELAGTDVYGETPLIAAIRWGAGDAATFLLEQGAEVAATDARGLNALSYAALQGDWKTAEMLVEEHGAKAESLRLPDGSEAASTLLEVDHGPLKKFLAVHGTGAKAGKNRDALRAATVRAVKRSNHNRLRELLADGQDADFEDASGASLLLIAVRLGSKESIDLLLEHGAEADRRAVLAALAREDIETVERLLDHGADLGLEAGNACPILLSWYDRGELDFVMRLIDAGLPADEPDGMGRTLATVAIERGDRTLLALAFDQGVAPEAHFHAVIESESEDLLDELLGRDVALDPPDENGETPLARLVRTDQPRLARRFVAAGADPNAETADGQTVLLWAIAQHDDKLVRLLLEAGADPEVRLNSPLSDEFIEHFAEHQRMTYYLNHDSGLTPLMLVAGTNQEEAAAALLEHGAKTAVYSRRYKFYPVSFAANMSDVGMIQRILGRDPDPEKQPRYVVVDLSDQKATVYGAEGEVVMTSRVSTGKKGYGTPAGEYVITNKHRHWTSTIYHASMPYFMRLSCGSFGLHQSNSVPSYPASHGCIRMPYSDARAFFGTCEVGDLVTIQP